MTDQQHRFMYQKSNTWQGVFFIVMVTLATGCKQPSTGGHDDSGRRQLPNILFLVADDAGWKDFGCYGHPTIQTPNIDRLAATGLKFNNAFLTTSSCSPSRISILSGKYAHTVRAEDMHVPLPDSVKLLPQYLKQKGYYTGNMLKTHYGPAGEKQFQWYSNNIQDFKKFLDTTGDSPFFMWVGFKDPHRPYESSEYKTPFDPAKVIVPPYLADTPETRQDLADYYSEIMRLDENIGWMLWELEQRGLRENTLIVFLSDNGAPFPGAKGTLYDTGIGTPLIMNWQKELKDGKTFDGLVSSIDLTPTVLHVAGIQSPADMPGKSLISLLSDNADYSRSHAFSERNWHGAEEHMRSVRTLEYKYITNAFEELPHGSPSDIVESPSWLDLYNLKDQKKLTPSQERLFRYPRPVEELYDVRTDPYEMNNLASDPLYANVVREMKDALHQWSASSDDVTPEHHPKADKTNRFTGKVVTVSKTSSANDKEDVHE